jgi:pyruvate/2-oxoglutarate dehydrogenase complex dihydrolipoamide dehydrogenase (E3) component
MTEKGETCDLLVIGGGSGGLTAAKYGVTFGAQSVVLIERERLGGDCTWSGCVPSKAFIHAAHMMKSARVANQFIAGEQTTVEPVVADLGKVREYVQGKVQEVYALEDDAAITKEGVRVVKGDAQFISHNTVQVTNAAGLQQTFVAKKIVVATGAKPAPVRVEGLDSVESWNYLNVWDQTQLPATLAVVGGGPIGSELAQAFARLGSKVTVFASSILPREAEDARKIVLEAFAEDGMSLVRARPLSVSQAGGAGSPITIQLKEPTKIESASGQQEGGGEARDQFVFDALLIATGRVPVVPAGLAEAGGATLGGRGGLVVDKNLRVKGCKAGAVFAVGDCVEGNMQFTHLAGTQGFTATRNALLPGLSAGAGFGPKGFSVCPRATFTDPEIAAAGYATAAEANAALGGGNGKPTKAYEVSIGGRHIDRAVCEGAASKSSITLVIETKGKGRVLGGRAVGPRAGETCCEIALAASKRMPIAELGSTIHPYPTHGFGLMDLASQIAIERLVVSCKGRYLGVKPRGAAPSAANGNDI